MLELVMDIIQTVILSVVEGITEFLPISSTGHLILTSDLLNIAQTEFVKSFEIIIQLGAILAVVVIYFKKLLKNFILWKNIVLAFLPSALFGLFLYDFIKGYLIGNSLIVILSLLVGGLIILIFENYYKERKNIKLNSWSYIKIGLFQVLSMIPGVSRALTTIFGGIIVGMDRKTATEFSFLLAIPTMLGATAIDLVKTDLSVWTSSNITTLLMGFVLSFVTAYLVVKWLIKYVQSNNFVIFGIYRILLAILFLGLL